jgi:raffinose/stachyose/melibiose transport system permease protein
MTNVTARTTAARSAPKVSEPRHLGRQLRSFSFIAPALVIYGLFVLWPFLRTIYISFTDAERSVNGDWVGIDNYKTLFTDEWGAVWNALRHNLLWIAIGTFVPIFISLVLATMVWSKVKGTTFFRVVYFMPVVLAPSIVAIVWRWIYHPLFGPINTVFDSWLFDNPVGRLLHIDDLSRGWLAGGTALYAILFAAIWAYFGFAFVILTAALGNIDDSLIEAAKLDGANAAQRFFYVIIPQLAPVLTMLTTFTMINGFNLFDIVWAAELENPKPGTEVLGTYVYQQAIIEGNVGFGSAATMLITVLSLLVSYAVITVRERDTEDAR